MGLRFASSEAVGLRLRPMADDDLAFVEALYGEVRAPEFEPLGWPAPMLRAFLARQHQLQHRHYREHFAAAEWLIVERAGEPVGRLYVEETDALIHLIDISLVAESRGRGLGSALLADVISHADAAAKPIRLHVEQGNPARRLYDRLGFVLIENRGVYDELERVPSCPSGRVRQPVEPVALHHM